MFRCLRAIAGILAKHATKSQPSRRIQQQPDGQDRAVSFRYTIFGLTVDSQLECPELMPGLADAAPDFRIVQDDFPEQLEGATQRTRYSQYAPGTYQLQIDQVARYRVEGGRVIRVNPDPRAAEGDVRLWLLGTCLGALIYQRGLLPLHVSAVAVDGQAFAFCGESGAGKSTLAAALHRQGFPLLTDDVGLAVPGAAGVLLHPGMPRIKLWRDTLQEFELADTPGLIRDLTRTDKFHVPVHQGFQPSALPLAGIYVLQRAPDDQIRIERVSGHKAIGFIRENSYRPWFPIMLGGAEEHLHSCAQVNVSAGVYVFERPWNLARLEPALAVLIGHMQSAVGRRLPVAEGAGT
jgi:hypothetical protein